MEHTEQKIRENADPDLLLTGRWIYGHTYIASMGRTESCIFEFERAWRVVLKPASGKSWKQIPIKHGYATAVRWGGGSGTTGP